MEVYRRRRCGRIGRPGSGQWKFVGHGLWAVNQQWAGISGISMESDFVEAPSEMLEEMIRSPQVLAGFARHYQTNEPIPAELVARMNRAAAFVLLKRFKELVWIALGLMARWVGATRDGAPLMAVGHSSIFFADANFCCAPASNVAPGRSGESVSDRQVSRLGQFLRLST